MISSTNTNTSNTDKPISDKVFEYRYKYKYKKIISSCARHGVVSQIILNVPIFSMVKEYIYPGTKRMKFSEMVNFLKSCTRMSDETQGSTLSKTRGLKKVKV